MLITLAKLRYMIILKCVCLLFFSSNFRNKRTEPLVLDRLAPGKNNQHFSRSGSIFLIRITDFQDHEFALK
jgi:hypothetical protein